jgi:RHS repeat-associated protein
MKNNPYRVSFIRSVCGDKTPFFIGVFLIFSLILGQPLLVLAAVDRVSDTTITPADTVDQKLIDHKVDSAPVIDQTTTIPPTDTETAPLAIDPIVDQTTPLDTANLTEEQIADLEALDEMLANGEINQEDYDARKGAIIGNANSQNLNSPLNITGVNPKSQTLGKYISPDVSVVDGSLNYAYQIAVPPGRAGLSPNIKLVYDSNNTAQNSIVGIGWALSIPYIQRINKEGVNKTYDENNFISSLDGELIDQGNSIYIPRVENGSFLKYNYNNINWIVTDKNGIQYKFGTSSNGRQDDPNNSSKVFTWMLDKVTDTNGNTISFTYFKDQGQIYPDTISYNQTGIFSIEFSRTSRTYPNISYGTAFKVVTAYKISSINIKVNGNLSNKYTISLNDDNLVQSVLVEGYQGNQNFSLPPTQFKNFTDEGSKKWDYDSNFTLPTDSSGKVLALDYTNSTYYGNSFMDINGDGLLDIVRWTANQPNGTSSSLSGNRIYLNTGKGFEYNQNFLLPTDSNGNVLVLNYTNCVTSSCNPDPSNLYGNKFIDINGDGLIDIVRWDSSRVNGEYDLYKGNQVFLNTGSGFALDADYLLPTDSSGKVLAIDYNRTDYYGSSFVDINGDGRPDIVRWDRSQLRGYSSLASGNQVFINTGTGFILDSNPSSGFNFTNTLPIGSNGKVLTLDYTLCKLPQTCSSTVSNLYGNLFMDVNGDGFVDIIRWTQGQPNGYYSSGVNTNGNQVFLNTGSSFQLESNFLLPTDSSGKVLALDYKYGNINTFYGNSFMDINDDGLVDVVRWLANQPNGYSNPNYTSGNQVFLNTGSGFALDADYLLPTDSSGKVLALDYNYGNTFGNSFKDVNGDDFPDIVRWDTENYNGNSALTRGNEVFINTGSKFILGSGYTLPTIPNGKVLTLDYTICKPISCTYSPALFYGNSFMDINGDGILDIVRWDNSQLNGAPNNTVGPTKGNQIFSGTVGRKAIKKIVSSLGGEDIFSFKGIRQFTDVGKAGLNVNIPSGYRPFVVDSHVVDYKNENPDTTTYEYHGASFFNPYNEPLNKKIAGFSEVIKTTPNRATVITKYHQGNGQTPADSYTKIGKVYEEIIQDENNNLFSRTRINYAENNLGGIANSVQTSARLTQIYDGNNTHRDTQETYTYDQYGNLTQKISLGEVIGAEDGSVIDVGNDKFSENISYATNTTNYIVGLSSVDTVLNQAGDKIRESKTYYDNLPLGSIEVGNQTKKESWKTGTTYVNTQITYNSYGLPISSIDERGKVTNYTYDAYNLYPIKTKNPLGHETNFTYDYATGKLNSKTDQNGFVYQSTYDGFGRIVEEKIPDLVAPYAPVLKTKYVYIDIPLSVSVKTMNYLDNVNTIDSYQYFDGFGRVIQERSQAEGVNNFNVKDIVYNDSGLVKKESLKYLSIGNTKTEPTIDALYVAYDYDVLGRVTGTESTVGTANTIYNDWETTSIDANNKIKNYYKDAYGNLVKVEEKNGNDIYTTTYEWDGNKNLTKITDALGNVRNFSYDGLGRRLGAEDLHAPADTTFGVWAYVYDEAGNLTQTTSPKEDTVLYSYDNLNRIVAEFYPTADDPKASYLYDSGTNGIGKPYATFTAGANTSYSYNSNGAITTENKIIDGVTYSTSYTYDRLGNIITITYPEKSQVKYSYNNAGLLDKIERKENGGLFTNVVSNFDYSPIGQVTKQVNANGTTTTNSYDATKLYRLINTKTINSAQIKLQDLTYDYDAVGNILSLVDSSNTNNAKTSSYTYDDLNRLLSATITRVASGQTEYTQKYTYDATGNILSGPLGNYVYAGVGYTNPHAVTKIVSPNYTQDFTYDKNGNMTGRSTTTSVILNGSVNPNGKNTTAWFETSTGNSAIQNLGSGTSPVALTPFSWNNLLPDTTYSFRIVSNNSDGTTYGNWTKFTTASNLKPIIFSATVSTPGTTSATLNGQVSGSGESTDAWYESSKTGSQKLQSTHIENCDTATSLPSFNLTGLTASTSYQFRVVASSAKGTTTGNWVTFTTKDLPPPPPPPPGIPPPPPKPPIFISATVTPNLPMFLFNDAKYSWDYKNELTRVSSVAGDNVYAYDNSGSRVKTTTSGVVTYYPSKLYEISGSQKTKYIYTGDTLMATVKVVGTTVTPTYTHTDHLGSTNVTSNSTGAIAQLVDYYPYGLERICSGDCGADKKYIGQYYDNSTGLNYLNARYYDGNIGRFISIDPVFWEIDLTEDGNRTLLDPQLQNSYSYARNNPIVLSDPDGRIIPLIILAVTLAFVAWDAYDVYHTQNDSNATVGEKNWAMIFLAADLIPGEAIGKDGIKLIGKGAKLVEEGIKAGKATEKGIDVVRAGENVIKAGDTIAGLRVTKHAEDGFKIRNFFPPQVSNALENGIKYIDTRDNTLLHVVQEQGKRGYTIVTDLSQKVLVSVEDFVRKLNPERFKKL